MDSCEGDLSKDEHVASLESSIKNYEMRQNHSKIALQNLEKSISTYHEKLEILEGVVTGNYFFISKMFGYSVGYERLDVF